MRRTGISQKGLDKIVSPLLYANYPTVETERARARVRALLRPGQRDGGEHDGAARHALHHGIFSFRA